MPKCPTEATLRLIGTEAFGEATLAGLEGHVELCPECQKILEAASYDLARTPHPASIHETPSTLPGLAIGRELGRGGSSVVYLARELTLDRPVAVKLIPRNSLLDAHAREHWLAEARALSRSPHDHVVTIHRVGESEEWLWLVLEYVPGGTLKDRLKEPLSPRDAARITEMVARAVGFFHTRGVFHLDLKPSNILLDGEPGTPWDRVSPKISDFGISRLEGEPGTTQTGANGPKGTPSYMAPEQVAALPGTIGAAADRYALGALLYHLLTGRPPFQGTSTAETLDQVRLQDPAPPRRINGRIPRDLETICLTCLEKEPNRRYRTAEAVAEDLRLWLDGRPIKARRVSPIGLAWRFCRRHPAVAILLAMLAMTLITGVLGLFVLLDRAEAERARLAEARRNAEAQEKFSAGVAGQLAFLLRSNIRHHVDVSPEQMLESLRKLRTSATDLRSREIFTSIDFAQLQMEIGSALISLSKFNEAYDLIDQAVADLRLFVASHPEDRNAQGVLIDVLNYSGNLASSTYQFEKALDLFEESFSLEMANDSGMKKIYHYNHLYRELQTLAHRCGQACRTEEEQRTRGLSRRILLHLAGSGPGKVAASAFVDLEDLGRLLQQVELKAMPWHEKEHIVSQWLADSVRPLSPFRSATSASKYDRAPESGAIALISEIRERCSRFGLAHSVVPATIRILQDDASGEASEWRSKGRLDEAQATAARLMALAREVVREYPDSGHSHLVLSVAYDQVKKNAMRMNDNPLVEDSLGRAIEEAQRALTLNPGDAVVRPHLNKLTDQLASFKAERKSPRP